MLPMLTQHKMITAALLATLSLSACGSKKDVSIAAPPPADSQPAPAASPAPAAGNKSTDANGQAGTPLPDPSKAGDTVTPPVPEPLPPATPPKNSGGKTPAPTQQPNPVTPTPLPPAAGTVKPPTPPPVVKPTQPVGPQQPAKPAPAPPVASTVPSPEGISQLPSDYVTNDPENLDRSSNITKRMTGAVTPEGLVYTSSSTDELLNFLRARNEKVGAETRRLNLQAAASVTSAKLSVDSLSGDAMVTLKVQEGSETKVYNLVGSNGEQNYASKLRSVRAANGEKTTGARAIEGTLQCLDLDGGCENTLVRLKIGTSPGSAIVNVVFRNSSADLYFNLPGKYSDNPEYLWVRDFIQNTILDRSGTNKIQTIRMSSFEVVNGRSGVAMSMKGVNKELLAFAGPLLAPEVGTGVNITLNRITKDQDDTLDLVSLDDTKLTYANYIGDARLVANNGLGQVRLMLKMRKRGTYAQDVFTVTFMRTIKPLVDLNEQNLQLK